MTGESKKVDLREKPKYEAPRIEELDASKLSLDEELKTLVASASRV